MEILLLMGIIIVMTANLLRNELFFPATLLHSRSRFVIRDLS
jgi:hypothetical protein